MEHGRGRSTPIRFTKSVRYYKKGYYYEPTQFSCAVLELPSDGHTEFSAWVFNFFFGILERAGLVLFTMWRKYIWSCFFFFYSITKINADILGHLSLTRQHRPERCVISVYNVSSTRPSRNLSLSPPQTTFYGSYTLHESLQVVSRMVPLGQ